MDNKNISWENTISVHNIKSFNAGVDTTTVGNWVRSLTNFKYFCFNGVVFEPFSGYEHFIRKNIDFIKRMCYNYFYRRIKNMLVNKSGVTDHRSKRWDKFVYQGQYYSARERHWNGIFFLGFIPVWIELTNTLYHSRG